MRFQYKDTAQVKENEIIGEGKRIAEYVKHLNTVANRNNYQDPESSINLPFDENILNEVLNLKKQLVSNKLKYILNIGIGGSNLGTKAIYDAIYGYTDLLEPQRFPKIIFADTTDADYLSHIQNFLKTQIKSSEEIIVNAISKSGGTTETIANLEMLLGFIDNYKTRLVITTGENSELMEIAQNENIATLFIPKTIGGRYSVFSTVGLFPLACANIDVLGVLEGAMQARAEGLEETILENPALISAIIIYLQYKDGKIINDNFFFHPELESLGKWYRQLMAESIGKEHDLNKNTVFTGITPTVSIGSTDLHSMGQLYLGGPRNKLFTLIHGRHEDSKPKLPTELPLPLTVVELEGKKASTIMEAIYEGVKIAYKKQGLPFMEVQLNNIDENALGYFLQFKMIEMMYLGKLLNVNTFDQPNVEDYKLETRKILQEEN